MSICVVQFVCDLLDGKVPSVAPYLAQVKPYLAQVEKAWAEVEPFAVEHTRALLGVAAVLAVIYALLRRRDRLLAQAALAARLAQETRERRRAQAQQPPVVPPVPVVAAVELPPIQADPSRLPDQEPWVGRQQPLALLDAALDDPQVAVVCLVAADGVGKTRLVQHWVERCGLEAKWLTESSGLATCAAEAVQHASPVVVVVDGMETGAADDTTLVDDPGLSLFARQLAAQLAGTPAGDWQQRLILCCTRQPLPELAPLQGGWCRELVLTPLKENEATQLLHELGVRGKFADFRPVVKAMRGHALTLTLLGRLISRYYQGSMANRERLSTVLAPGAVEVQVDGLLTHYENVIWSDRPLHPLLLRLLSLFDRPVAEATLQQWCREIPMAHPLIGPGSPSFDLLRADLQQAGLLQVFMTEQPAWQLHPLVRNRYAQLWRATDPEGWQQARRQTHVEHRP
ncbi:MAG: hypothetical protein HQL87_03570 [Magnetococcales bacterium]|nr:hypothetical protein [Magnetococcales bacterium]